MAQEPIFMEERQNKILSLLNSQKKLLVNDLCDFFSVSPGTIRNDLNQLERLGLLKRTHGGAILPEMKSGYEQTSTQKENTNLEQKISIADYAVNLIDDDDIIALDTGTTTYCLAKQLLHKKNLTVVTNDIRIATLMEEFQNTSVILVGGILRKGFCCTTGSIANDLLSSLNVDKVFFSTNAVDPEGNLCTPDLEQAQTKRALIAMGRQSILLCDSSKFNSYSFARFGSLNDIETVITDDHIDTETLSTLHSMGIYPTIV